MALNVGPGITVTSIRDTVSGHEYLPQPSPLFELALNNGAPIQSAAIAVQSYQHSSGQAHIVGSAGSLNVDLTLTASQIDPVIAVALSVSNADSVPLFVRAVLPKLLGLVGPNDWSQNMGMIPQEIGIVAPLHLAPAAAHVFPVMRNSGSCDAAPYAQQDIFVIGNDGAFSTQFECNDDVWTSPIRLPHASLAPSGAQLAAVRRNAKQEDAFVIADDGAVWTSYEAGNGAFNTVRLWDGAPVTAPPGGGITAVARNDHQEDVLFVGNDGAIWSSSEQDDGRFSQPVRRTTTGFASPGAHIASIMRNSVQEDVFVVDANGILQTIFFNGTWNGPVSLSGPRLGAPGTSVAALVRNDHQEDVFVMGTEGMIWTTFERSDGPWAAPIPLAASSLGRVGGEIAAVRRNDHQEDLFWVDASGRISTIFETYDGPWSGPIPIGPVGIGRPGAPVAAIMRNDRQEDVYVVGAAGEVVTFFEVNDSAFIGPVPLPFPEPIGKKFNINVGLPNSMNTMEVTSIYDPAGGGGLFLADISGDLGQGVAPLQFTLSAEEAVGFWINNVPAGTAVQLPSLAIGVTHSGDWRQAVDFYVRTSPAARAATVNRPAWLDNAGAIYSHTGMGAGSIYLELGGITLKDQLTSFSNLPEILADANQLNTDIVYLLDYWEGLHTLDAAPRCDLNAYLQGQRIPYLNKSDYIPRLDLGGEAALISGISGIHSRAGRVIMYLEPFIIYTCSGLATTQVEGSSLTLGQLWGARDSLGNLYGPPPLAGGYQDYFSMVAPFGAWQDYITGAARRLVGKYGADGVFLDSYSWQMNWPVQNLIEGQSYSPREDSAGVLRLVDRVRQGMQQLNPETAVIGETTSGPIGKHWDGGLGAEFATAFETVEYITGRILASPTRYGAPDFHYFSNGHNVNELNQVFAAGHGLALCCNSSGDSGSFIHSNATYIAQLVRWRQDYADALIHGRLRYQPETGSAASAAYSYLGTQSRILTVVNTSVGSYDGSIQLDSDDARFSWINLATNQILRSDAAGRLHLQIPPEGLLVMKADAN